MNGGRKKWILMICSGGRIMINHIEHSIRVANLSYKLAQTEDKV